MGLVAVINLATGFCTLDLLFVAIPSSSISWSVLGINESCSLYTRNSKPSYLIKMIVLPSETTGQAI